MPRKRPQVLGVDLNRSESRRRAACVTDEVIKYEVTSVARQQPVTKLPHRDWNRSLQNGAFRPAQFGLNSEGESISRPLRGCEMIGKLAEPNLTRRLALLAEARRD